MYLVCITPSETVGGIPTYAVSSVLRDSLASVTAVTWPDTTAPSGHSVVGISGINLDQIAVIALDNTYTVVWSDENIEAAKSQYQAKQAAAEAARTQAAIQHLATSESPDAKAARVYLRYLFTAINDLRELHGLPRKLEPEIRDELVTAAGAGYGSPISLT